MSRPLLLSLIFVLAGCGDLIDGVVGSKAVVEGRVVDAYDQPLAGVEVQILKSTYTTVSGQDGSYSVPFAPGNFQVSYSLDGYNSYQLDLNIQQATTFPAEQVKLIPLPDAQGIYHLGRSGLKPIEPAKVDRQVIQSGWSGSRSKYFCTGEGTSSVTSSQAQFVDTNKGELRLARLGDYGLVYYPKGSSEDDKGYNGFTDDEVEYAGLEGIMVRTFAADPGQYAWVTVKRNSKGEARVNSEAPCFPFKVVPG